MEKEKNICEACEVHKDIIDSINKNYPSEEVLYSLAEIFKVFGDPTRVKILFVLFETELCVCGIADLLNMNQILMVHMPLRYYCLTCCPLKRIHFIQNAF